MLKDPFGRHLGVALAALSTAVFLGLMPAPAAAEQDTLRIQINSDIRSTEPGTNRDANTDEVMLHVMEGLVAFREDASVGPLLAKSIEVSPDGRTYTFKLRDGISFHDGTPFRAEDVLFAWKRYMDPATVWRCQPEFGGDGASHVVGVSAPDPMTVVFELASPSALFLATMARADCGETAIYPPSALDADGKWQQPIGTGPYKFGEWRRGEFVELLRNEHYSALPGVRDGATGNKAPLVPKIRFLIIPDAAAAKAALLSGAVDIVPLIADTDLAELQAHRDILIDNAPTMEVNAILFQTRDPLLKDVRIRRAIVAALDLPQLVDGIADGQSRPSYSVIPTPSAYYGPVEAALPKRDLAAARQLLTDAGYHGQPIKMVVNKRYDTMYRAAVLSQAMLAEAGIAVEIEVLDWATELSRYTQGQYQAMSFGYSARLDPSLSYEMVSGDKAKQPRKVWDNPDGLALLARSMQVSDKAARQAIFDQMEALMRADVPMIPLYAVVQIGAARSVVEGYKNWALGQARGWGVSLKPGG